ncbi:hypothetical protein PR048_021103, partial [Dryococelus australis]
MWAQCYDRASNMRGPYKEVVARILKENPVSMYTHCNAHILNLCIVSCCTEVKPIWNTFFTLQTLYNFIEISIKHHAIFLNICKSSPDEAVRSLLDNFETTLTALSEIAATDHNYGGEASTLLKCMEDFNFLFNLLLLEEFFLSVTSYLRPSRAAMSATKQTDALFTQLFNHCTEVAENYGFQPAQLPRKGRIPQKIDGGTTILFSLLDVLVQEIRDRLAENNLDVLNHLSTLLSKNKIDSSSVDVCDYNVDKKCLMAEVERFCIMESMKNKWIEERVVACVENKMKNIFPLIFELFCLYLTIPINSAFSERSFSCLRQLKTYCRNSSRQERLSSLAHLATEQKTKIDTT